MTDGVRQVREPCNQCPWVGRFEGLRSGRLKDLREGVQEKDGVFICHKTMEDDKKVAGEGSAAVCAGWAKIGDWPLELRLAHTMEMIDWIEVE